MPILVGWRFTPAAPLFGATLRQAAYRVDGRCTLSFRLNHLPPIGTGLPAPGHALTPLPSADTMRSVQIETSAHHSSRRPPWASVPCVALSALSRYVLSPASCLPCLAPVLLPVPLHRSKR